MKRLKTPNPTQSVTSAKSRKTFTIVALLSIVVVVLLGVVLCHVETIGPRGTITDPERIAGYDAEFAEFIGMGHNVAEYHYVDARTSNNLGFGYGPLYDVAGFQIIVGKTGAIGAIAYGKSTWGKWDMYPNPNEKGTSPFILVFDGCIAPQAWWGRPVLASMLYGIPTTDGNYLPELMVWVPWPDWIDFDNPPVDATIEAQSWYWNGERYVPTNFVEDQPPLFSTSQISVKAPFKGAFPLRKVV